jgi:hypothetical protein
MTSTLFKASSFVTNLRRQAWHRLPSFAINKQIAPKEISASKWEIEEIAWATKGNVEPKCDQSKEDMRQWISDISKNEEVVASAVASRQQWNATIKQKLHLFAIHQTATNLQRT